MHNKCNAPALSKPTGGRGGIVYGVCSTTRAISLQSSNYGVIEVGSIIFVNVSAIRMNQIQSYMESDQPWKPMAT